MEGVGTGGGDTNRVGVGGAGAVSVAVGAGIELEAGVKIMQARAASMSALKHANGNPRFFFGDDMDGARFFMVLSPGKYSINQPANQVLTP